MDNKQKLILYLLAFILESLGIIMLIAYNWKIALAVFLILWGNNISNDISKDIKN